MINTIARIPRYVYKKNPLESLNFNEVINHIDKPILNLDSIYDVMKYGYVLENATLIQGLERESIVDVKKILEFYNYYKNNQSYKNNVSVFFDLLVEEIKLQVKDHKNIGILLSGGLDSRIVAGVLKYVQDLFGFNVKVFTWGLVNSRDVVYSKQIAEKFDWDIEILFQTEDTLLDALIHNTEIGCETNPLNIHSMKKVKDNKLDLILAGSYGDSIGRAEYSGQQAEYMPTNAEKSKDMFGFFLTDFAKERQRSILKSEQEYYDKYKDININILKEISKFKNHHAKYLQVSMSLVDRNIPLKQLFTSYELVGFVLSLDYEFRYKDLYKELLKMLPGDIGNIPWARTGKKFLDSSTIEASDNLLASHHEYPKWLKDNHNLINGNINLDLLDNIGIFNMENIKKSIKSIETMKYTKLNRVDRNIIWLSSFSLMMNKYSISYDTPYYRFNTYDLINKYTFNLKNSISKRKS